jgi:hypothetical protein
MKNYLNKEIKYSVMLLFILINLVGCGSVSRESVLMQNIEDAKMNSMELGIRINEAGSRYSLEIENSADKIIAATKDAGIKKNALLWKLYGIPALLKSVSIQDPLASGTDIYVLIAQMRQFFENGNGKDLFGKHQQIAVDAVKRMEKEFFNIASEFRDSAVTTKSNIDEWVKNHHIEDIRFNRISTVTAAAKELSQKKSGLTSSVGDMVNSINNLQDKLTLYADFIPKQARWQAEYMMYELIPDSLNKDVFGKINSLTGSIESIGGFIENSPGLISSVRQKIMQDINIQRIATLELLQEERKTILEAVTSERIKTLNEINRQRVETLNGMNKLAGNTVTSSGIMLIDVADKILIRLVILLFITFILGLVFMRFAKSRMKLN